MRLKMIREMKPASPPLILKFRTKNTFTVVMKKQSKRVKKKTIQVQAAQVQRRFLRPIENKKSNNKETYKRRATYKCTHFRAHQKKKCFRRNGEKQIQNTKKY
eukprot:GEMP01057556.1.p1 GENE.GEMP01057556.1~~GEMP01057556.1.p1  ORF type:complete len:103 (-),score=9.06 GEMP01057556.1:81-389(-)